MSFSLSKNDYQPKDWRKHPAAETPSLTLRNFRYANERAIDSYIEQMGGIAPEKKQKRKLGLRNFSPTAELEIEEVTTEKSLEFKISLLLELLQLKEKLSLKRPEVAAEFTDEKPPIILEKFVAQAYVFPIVSLRQFEISHFKVWVGAPDVTDFSDEEFVWSGSYVFLTEIHFDNRDNQTTISGCSALRFLFNAIVDQPLYERKNNPGTEILGRWDDRSIGEKLQSIGGMVIDAREIEVLYRLRYMTDEQNYVANGSCRRIHDIVGYPFFIAD